MTEPKVVIVTGASSGIGLHTALALGRRGHRVYATMRDPGRADNLQRVLDAEQLQVEVLQLDVTDPTSVSTAVATVLSREGRVDAVVNNAGIAPFAAIEHSTDDEWLAVLDTNLIGAVRLIRAVLPAMRYEGAGTIVNVSSIAGRLAAVPTQGAYAASKHALCALTDAVVAECAPFGLSAYCIEPGFFATDIMRGNIAPNLGDGDPYRTVADGVQEFFRSALADAPLPSEVADTITTAIESGLRDGVHHPVGAAGHDPTPNAARSVG